MFSTFSSENNGGHIENGRVFLGNWNRIVLRVRYKRTLVKQPSVCQPSLPHLISIRRGRRVQRDLSLLSVFFRSGGLGLTYVIQLFNRSIFYSNNTVATFCRFGRVSYHNNRLPTVFID